MPVMETVIVLHTAFPCSKLYLAGNYLDHLIKRLLFVQKQEVFCHYCSNSYPVAPGPCPVEHPRHLFHGGPADHGLCLPDQIGWQFIANQKHQVYKVCWCCDLVIMPIVAYKIMLHPEFKSHDNGAFNTFILVVPG